VDRELILSLAHQAGWNLKFTRQTSERDFSLASAPLEIEAIERFVDLVLKARSLTGGDEVTDRNVEGV
jgi:uncharacterized protein with ACT and thioredoxin-like domain